jgi:2,4'-dihydroxyacetophenone dioxygenase
MYYGDPYDQHLGYEDMFTKIELCRANFEAASLGTGYVDTLIS